MATKILQEVRLNNTGKENLEGILCGAVAVKDPLIPNNWGVMNPGINNYNARGGHWATDDQVADWEVISPQREVEIPEESENPEETPST